MARGLDHIVHAVRDLDAAAGLYRRLGFEVGSRNRHPRAWGTQNHIVQLPGTFIELLTVADPTGIAPHAPRFFSFGAFNRDFLARGEGLAMLVLEGRGAPDAAEFRARRHRRFRALRVRARGKAPRRHAGQGGVCACLCGGPGQPGHRLLHLPAPLSRELLESGLPAAPQHRQRGRRRGPGRRQSQRPSHLPRSLHRRTRGAGDLGGHRHQDAARQNSGDATRCVPRALRHRHRPRPGAARDSRRFALRFAIWRRSVEACGPRTSQVSSRMGHIVVGPDTAMGATLVFEQN